MCLYMLKIMFQCMAIDRMCFILVTYMYSIDVFASRRQTGHDMYGLWTFGFKITQVHVCLKSFFLVPLNMSCSPLKFSDF